MDTSAMIQRQATCVTINGAAILIEGAAGIGKSSLALRLLHHGARLISDDVTVLKGEGGTLTAVLPERGRGCMEIRSLGVLSGFPTGKATPVRLRVVLVPNYPERLPQLQTENIDGVSVPTFYLWAQHPALPEQVLSALGIVNGDLVPVSTLMKEED